MRRELIGRETVAVSASHPVCILRPDRGGGRERSFDGDQEVHDTLVHQRTPATEPEARPVRLPSWGEPNEAMELHSNQMAQARVRRDRGGVAPQGDSVVALHRMVVYNERCLSGCSTRGERLQRFVCGTTRDDHSLGRPLSDRKRLGPYTADSRIRVCGAGGCKTWVRRLVDAPAVAQDLSALLGILQLGGQWTISTGRSKDTAIFLEMRSML